MARMKTFINDSQGRVIHYQFKRAPSVVRLREILRQAQRQGAKSLGIVGDVGQFQAYEMPQSGHQLVRAYRKTPGGVLEGLKRYRGSEPADYGILRQIELSTHAEKVADLRGASINFIY